MSYNILLCGVGGQGTVLASKLLAAAAGRADRTVHSAETIGMAQRGGPVTSHVRIGDDVYSPLIPKSCADLIIAFEPSEAVRNLPYLKENGALIVNTSVILPVTESLNPSGYTGTEMIAYLRSTIDKCIMVNDGALCESLGSTKFFNVAVLGVAQGAGLIDFTEEDMLDTIRSTVKEAFVDKNIEAFKAGRQAGAEEKEKNPAFAEDKDEILQRKLTAEEVEQINALKKEIEDKRNKPY